MTLAEEILWAESRDLAVLAHISTSASKITNSSSPSSPSRVMTSPGSK